MSEGHSGAASWVISLHRFEHDEVTGAITRRHEEVERLDGDLPAVVVAVMLELRYARLYQPQWDEATGKVDDKAAMIDAVIRVGHEPQLWARREEAGKQP